MPLRGRNGNFIMEIPHGGRRGKADIFWLDSRTLTLLQIFNLMGGFKGV